MKRLVLLSATALVLASCATPGAEGVSWQPQIDPQGVNQAKFEKDLAECRSYADANPTTNGNKEAGKKALTYGVLGAGAMGVAAIATGGLALLPAMAVSMATTGGTAALVGGATGKVEGNMKYQGIVDNCLKGRGYKVLG